MTRLENVFASYLSFFVYGLLLCANFVHFCEILAQCCRSVAQDLAWTKSFFLVYVVRWTTEIVGFFVSVFVFFLRSYFQVIVIPSTLILIIVKPNKRIQYEGQHTDSALGRSEKLWRRFSGSLHPYLCSAAQALLEESHSMTTQNPQRKEMQHGTGTGGLLLEAQN